MTADANNWKLRPDERKWEKDKANVFAKYYKEKSGTGATYALLVNPAGVFVESDGPSNK